MSQPATFTPSWPFRALAWPLFRCASPRSFATPRHRRCLRAPRRPRTAQPVAASQGRTPRAAGARLIWRWPRPAARSCRRSTAGAGSLDASRRASWRGSGRSATASVAVGSFSSRCPAQVLLRCWRSRAGWRPAPATTASRGRSRRRRLPAPLGRQQVRLPRDLGYTTGLLARLQSRRWLLHRRSAAALAAQKHRRRCLSLGVVVGAHGVADGPTAAGGVEAERRSGGVVAEALPRRRRLAAAATPAGVDRDVS